MICIILSIRFDKKSRIFLLLLVQRYMSIVHLRAEYKNLFVNCVVLAYDLPVLIGTVFHPSTTHCFTRTFHDPKDTPNPSQLQACCPQKNVAMWDQILFGHQEKVHPQKIIINKAQKRNITVNTSLSAWLDFLKVLLMVQKSCTTWDL